MILLMILKIFLVLAWKNMIIMFAILLVLSILLMVRVIIIIKMSSRSNIIWDDDNCFTIGDIHIFNDESDYAYDMKRPKLGEAMFDDDEVFENIFAEINVCPKLGDATLNDDIFSLPCLDMQSDYDENKVATYDDYCDETYAIKSSDYIYKTCHDYGYPFYEHYSLNVETIFSVQVFYDTPTIPNENKFAYVRIAYVESSKFSMLVDHEKNALGAGYIVEFFHDATENYYEGGTYACRNCNNIKFPLYVLKVLK